MAEAGLVIGAVSLAGLFTNCVDCFEYIQLGRKFRKDYQRSLLKLDIVKLRLSRWADAVNESQNRYEVSVGSAHEAQEAGELLGEIIELFADAEKVSTKYKSKSSADELAVYNTHTDLEPDIQTMHKKMRELALKRQKRSSFAQKAVWALYEEKHFRRLIEDATALVDALVGLFPAVQKREQELSIEEADEMRAEPRLDALEGAAEGVDQLLQSSVKQVIASQSSHTFTNNTAMEEALVRYGDEHAGGVAPTAAGHRYECNEASGKSSVHYGNQFGGKSVFDDGDPSRDQWRTVKPNVNPKPDVVRPTTFLGDVITMDQNDQSA